MADGPRTAKGDVPAAPLRDQPEGATEGGAGAGGAGAGGVMIGGDLYDGERRGWGTLEISLAGEFVNRSV